MRGVAVRSAVTLFRSCVIVASLLPLHIVLSGCIPVQLGTDARSTVLLSVVLRAEASNELQPTGLVVSLNEQPGSGGRLFAFAAETRIPGEYTAFVLRLDLPAGQHRLTHVSGVSAAGEAVPPFDVVTDMPFEVKAGTTGYLGRLEITAPRASAAPAAHAASGSPRMVISDAYEDDLPKFVRTWPALRAHAIGRRAPSRIVTIPAQIRVTDSRSGGGKSVGTAARLDSGAASVLPVKARAAFQLFLQSGYPRAFAVADSGHVGTSVGGKDVIRRAVQNCWRAQPVPRKSVCKLFALDDTLISTMHQREP
jgi:hypothetical protein